MRIWSLHPQYLDTKGLVALWRETLLAKQVLAGRTTGYRHHPQLQRFQETRRPLDHINEYLAGVYDEAVRRGYRFDRSKIDWAFSAGRLPVTRGQLEHEWRHLQNKLKTRDPAKYAQSAAIRHPDTHPLFLLVDGESASWEK